jgi:predicted porin
MKRHRIVVGALLGAVIGTAQAQSTVTLYGVIDEGFDYVNNSGGSKLFQLQDGTFAGIYGSRWGLKGEEDLGSGLKAIFKLENGFSVSTGKLAQGGREFGRQAYVGISSDKFGTVTVGRQYDSVVDYLAPVTLNGNWGAVFVHAGDIDNTSNSFRVNNSLKYASPSFGGFTFGGVYALSNSSATGVSATGLWSIGAAYSAGGLNIAAAYLFVKDPANFLTDGNYQPNTTGAAIGAAGPFSYVGNPKNQQIAGAGVTYVLGSATIGLDYSNVKFDDANGTTSSVKFNTAEIWGSYALTPNDTVGGGYTYVFGKADYSGAKPKYHLVGLFADHKLSKRTEIYVQASLQKAAGDATQADILEGGVASASSTDKQAAVRLGIVHKF